MPPAQPGEPGEVADVSDHGGPSLDRRGCDHRVAHQVAARVDDANTLWLVPTLIKPDTTGGSISAERFEGHTVVEQPR